MTEKNPFRLERLHQGLFQLLLSFANSPFSLLTFTTPIRVMLQRVIQSIDSDTIHLLKGIEVEDSTLIVLGDLLFKRLQLLRIFQVLFVGVVLYRSRNLQGFLFLKVRYRYQELALPKRNRVVGGMVFRGRGEEK